MSFIPKQKFSTEAGSVNDAILVSPLQYQVLMRSRYFKGDYWKNVDRFIKWLRVISKQKGEKREQN